MESSKYKTLSEFRKGCESAYKAFLDLGQPSGICDHLEKTRTVWDEASAIQEASKYSDRWSFQKNSAGAYRYLWKRDLLEQVFPALPDVTEWSYDLVKEKASECKHRTDFKMKYAGGHKWAYERGLLSELFGETYNTPECDNNVVYIWSVKNLPNVYKVGKTSDRLGIRRIKYTSRKGSIEAENIWLFHTSDAKSLEKDLLFIGQPYEFGYKFSGSTEFRQMTDTEFKQCLDICRQTSEGEING